MKATDTKKSLTVRQGKDKKIDQLKAVFQSFFDSPKTMKEADADSGIMRENITRYVRTFRQNKSIVVLRKRYCNVTKHLANEYTTNPDLFPKPTQLTLFDL
jgi:hypothetical protein